MEPNFQSKRGGMYGGKSGKVFGIYCGKLEESQETTI